MCDPILSNPQSNPMEVPPPEYLYWAHIEASPPGKPQLINKLANGADFIAFRSRAYKLLFV